MDIYKYNFLDFKDVLEINNDNFIKIWFYMMIIEIWVKFLNLYSYY